MMIKCSNYCSFHYTECSHLFCHTTLSVWVLRQGNLCILISFICCSSRPSAGIIIDIWSCGEPVERGCIIQLRLCHSLWQMMKSLSGGNKHNNISYHVIPLYCNHIYHTPESTAPWAVPPPLLAAPLSYIYSIYRHIHIHICIYIRTNTKLIKFCNSMLVTWLGGVTDRLITDGFFVLFNSPVLNGWFLCLYLLTQAPPTSSVGGATGVRKVSGNQGEKMRRKWLKVNQWIVE